MSIAMAHADPDMTLLRAYADAGDAGAFAELVRRHMAMVFHTCLRTLGDRQRAEDAAQEAFYRLMREPRRVRQSVAGYLHQVATRLCLDTLRSEKARVGRERTYGEALEADRRQRDRHWAEVAPHVDAALLELPEPSRRLLVEHFLEGRSQRELAKSAGVSPATMCRRVELAMTALRDAMRQRGVTVPAAAIGALLAAEASAAAPPSLAAGLGKLAMLSGPTVAAAPTSVGATLKCVLVGSGLAAGLGVAALMLVLAVMLMPTTPLPTAAPALDLAATDTLTPTSTARPQRSSQVLVIRSDPSLRADQVQLVQVPAPGQTQLAVGFGDGHVRTLPRAEVDTLVQRQTGRPLSDFIASAPRVAWSPSEEPD